MITAPIMCVRAPAFIDGTEYLWSHGKGLMQATSNFLHAIEAALGEGKIAMSDWRIRPGESADAEACWPYCMCRAGATHTAASSTRITSPASM